MQWNIDFNMARELQKKLSKEVKIEPLKFMPKTIAGVDVSIERFGIELYAGIVLLKYPELEVIAYATERAKVEFPYVPGLLSFREIPGILKCLDKLIQKPDLIMVDGQGITHPRGLGIASHLGLVTGIPTIGCAKSKLFGVYDEPEKISEAKEIFHPKTKMVIGYALKSRERSNPLLISPGHRVSLKDTLEIVKNCIRGYRLPEPTRQAHLLVNKFRKGEL
jgi:deoxyribonuclease V